MPNRVIWLSNDELKALIEADYEARGVRLYVYKLNHLIDTYAVFRKWAADNRVSQAQTAWSQLGAQLYDDVFDKDSGRKKRQSLRNWTRELQRLGVLQVREHKNQRGAFDGIWWALTSDAVSARSSAGSSVGPSRFTRRQETRQQARERRIRPHCRRSGRKGVGLYERRRSPISAERVWPSIAPRSLKGPGGVQQDVTRAELAVHTRPSHDVTAPAAAAAKDQPPDSAAAVAATRRANSIGRGAGSKIGSDRSAELAAALAAFEVKFGKASPAVTPAWFERYSLAASRADLYGGWGKRQAGLGARYVVDRIEAWDGKPHRRRGEKAGDMQLRRPKAPASIAYFIALLEDAAKHWRHAYRHEHGLCRRPELCRANAWMYPAHDDRLRNRAKWIAYDREVEQVRRTLNDAGYTVDGGEAHRRLIEQYDRANGQAATGSDA